MIASRLVPPVSDDSDDARSLLHALRAEVRAFVVAQRREGRIPPRVDSWLTGWDEEFTHALAAKGWLGMTVPV
jgi:hypothetical protein